MSQENDGARPAPARKNNRPKGPELEQEPEYENVKGCLTLLALIVVFFAVTIGFALLTKQ